MSGERLCIVKEFDGDAIGPDGAGGFLRLRDFVAGLIGCAADSVYEIMDDDDDEKNIFVIQVPAGSVVSIDGVAGVLRALSPSVRNLVILNGEGGRCDNFRRDGDAWKPVLPRGLH